MEWARRTYGAVGGADGTVGLVKDQSICHVRGHPLRPRLHLHLHLRLPLMALCFKRASMSFVKRAFAGWLRARQSFSGGL